MSLRNKIIINTRPLSGKDVLTDLFIDENSKVHKLPLIEIVPLGSWVIREHLKDIGVYNYLVFTSANGVDLFFEHHKKFGEILPKATEILCIGKKTAETLENWGRTADLISTGSTSKDFLVEIKAHCKPKSKILLTLGRVAPDLLRQELSKDFEVFRVDLYDTIVPKIVDDKVMSVIKSKKYDSILLTSPSGIHTLRGMIGDLKGHKFACIGETTEHCLRAVGGEPQVVAKKSNAQGLFDAVKTHFKR